MNTINGSYFAGTTHNLYNTRENKDINGRNTSRRSASGFDPSDAGMADRNAFNRHMAGFKADTAEDENNKGNAGSGGNAPGVGAFRMDMGINTPRAGIRTYAPEACAGEAGTREVTPLDMSLTEYIQYINDKVAAMSRGAYRGQNSIFIYISIEGYEAMQKDPEYESWVLDNIRGVYAGCTYQSSYHGYHCYQLFGAAKEDYCGISWYSGGRAEQDRREEFKRQQKKRRKELLKKYLERRYLEKKYLEKKYLEKKYLEKKYREKKRLEKAVEYNK